MVVGLGMDLVEVERVVRMLEKEGQPVTTRLLTEGEWAYCARMHTPAEHVAARFEALGYAPQTAMREGLQRFADWFRAGSTS